MATFLIIDTFDYTVVNLQLMQIILILALKLKRDKLKTATSADKKFMGFGCAMNLSELILSPVAKAMGDTLPKACK